MWLNFFRLTDVTTLLKWLIKKWIQEYIIYMFATSNFWLHVKHEEYFLCDIICLIVYFRLSWHIRTNARTYADTVMISEYPPIERGPMVQLAWKSGVSVITLCRIFYLRSLRKKIASSICWPNLRPSLRSSSSVELLFVHWCVSQSQPLSLALAD